MKKEKGFSYIELVVVFVIASLLFVIAAPRWQKLMQSTCATTQANQIVAMIHLARSEAIKRNATMTLCKSDDQHTCSGGWSDGQILFIDQNKNGKVAASQDIVRAWGPIEKGSMLQWYGVRSDDYLQFRPGGGMLAHNGKFIYCPDKKNDAEGIAIIVNLSGRARISKTNEQGQRWAC